MSWKKTKNIWIFGFAKKTSTPLNLFQFTHPDLIRRSHHWQATFATLLLLPGSLELPFFLPKGGWSSCNYMVWIMRSHIFWTAKPKHQPNCKTMNCTFWGDSRSTACAWTMSRCANCCMGSTASDVSLTRKGRISSLAICLGQNSHCCLKEQMMVEWNTILNSSFGMHKERPNWINWV